ncbi:cupin [Lentibacillus sp. N15]|uniref:cupin n=1 Tax=Lentibacillus songyuanensis TaxID=3136161 RepID=UPI0031BB617D
MEIFPFPNEAGRKVTQYESSFFVSPILKTSSPVQIGHVQLAENGVIGYHQATMPQMLIVLKGIAAVRGKEDKYVTIQQGYAVFWELEEWHETVSEHGLTAIIVEGKDVKPLTI